MNKRLLSLFALMLACLMSGCRLAVPEAEEPAQPDRLAGVFITTEHFDLFDFESYIQDHANSLTQGSNEISADESRAYEGRIYAALTEHTAVNEQTGEKNTHMQYAFPDLKGILLASFLMQEAGQEPYWSSDADEGLCEVKTHFTSTDYGETIEQSASLYMRKGANNLTFYFNPVYQQADGRVYLMAGSGMSQSGEHGGAMTHSMTDERSLNFDGTEKNYRTDLAITVDCIDVPEQVILIQMDKSHHELCRDIYSPEEMPKEIAPQDGAAYFLIETHMGTEVSYAIHQPADESLEIFYCREDGLCLPNYTQVLWPEE